MSTDLDGALADPSYQIYFDGVTTAARANIATHGDAEGAMEFDAAKPVISTPIGSACRRAQVD